MSERMEGLTIPWEVADAITVENLIATRDMLNSNTKMVPEDERIINALNVLIAYFSPMTKF